MNSRFSGAVLSISAAAVTSLLGAGVAHADIQWGAIAEGTYGFNTVTNYPSRQEAIDAAVANCNNAYPARWVDTGSGGGHTAGGDCKARLVFPSGTCAAIAQGYGMDSKGNLDSSPSRYSVGSGASIAEADFDAMAKNAGYKVSVIKSVCQS
ncbi:DUF4189 domain-containing protein [Nocardia sp. NPDC004711]